MCINWDSLRLVYEENFKTDLELGEWANENNPYKKAWQPFEATTSARNPDATKKCYLTPNNVMVKDGQMTLLATETDEYYMGTELRTKEFYDYGYFEFDVKINSSMGICPALWFVASRHNKSQIEYEFDLMECFGRTPDAVKGTVLAHTYPNGEYTGTQWRFVYHRLSTEKSPVEGNCSFFGADWGNEFHKFAFDWQPDSLTWYIDDKPVLFVKPSEGEDGKFLFDEPMIAIMTVYSGVDVCSPKTGLPDQTTDWENGNSMTVRSIKFYKYK